MRAWVIACLALVALLGAATAAAQPLDYGQLLGGGGDGGETAGERPRQSLPMTRFDPGSVPDAEAYGRLAREPGDAFGMARDLIEVFRARALAILTEAPGAFADLHVTLRAASPTGRTGHFAAVAAGALLLLALGRGVTALSGLVLARPLLAATLRPDPRGYLDKLPVLAYRLALSLFGTALTLLVAGAPGLVLHDGHGATLTTAMVIFGAYAAIRVVDAFWRMALCPFLPAYRLPAVPDAEARRAYRWMSLASGFSILAMAFCYWASALGLSHAAHVVLTVGLTLAIVLALVVALHKNRGAVRAAILGGAPRERASWLTLLSLRLWLPLAVLYLLGSWAMLAFDLVMGVRQGPLGLVVPYLVLLGGALVYALANYAIERAFHRPRRVAALNAESAARRAAAAGEDAVAAGMSMRADDVSVATDGGADPDGDEEGGGPAPAPGPRRVEGVVDPPRGMRSFEDLARRVASLLAIGAAAWGLFYYWGGPILFAENMVLGIAEDVIDILLVGYVLFHAIRIWMDGKIAEEVGEERLPEPGEGEGGGAGASRLATLLPLVRNFVLALVSIAIGLVVASELGVNVAPLFAGAGVLGLAIGFGSQTLVRDILSGAFFLMDDAFRKGEYIDVGDVKGVVEKISLRSFQLRHHLGMLHTIPFGELRYLTNYSRDWVMMKLPIRVTYDTDVERVRKLIKKLGQELLEDEQIGDKFLMPLKSQGVIQMDDSAMILRVKFMCRPGEQWVIRKRVFQEIRALFEREGIRFAHREVTVRIPDLDRDRPLSPDQAEAVGGAARTAVDVSEAETGPAPGFAGAVGDR